MTRLKSTAVLGLLACVGGCGPSTRSSMTLERRPRPLAVDGPDAVALPVSDRYRYGVVLGSVLTDIGLVRRTVEVRTGQVWRAVVTMHPIPERIAG